MVLGLLPSGVRGRSAPRRRANRPVLDDDDDHLPQPKSAGADFGHFVEWPNPRYSEVRLGGGRPAPAGRVGVTAAPQIRPGCLGGTAATPPRTAFGSKRTSFALPLQGRVQHGLLIRDEASQGVTQFPRR